MLLLAHNYFSKNEIKKKGGTKDMFFRKYKKLAQELNVERQLTSALSKSLTDYSDTLKASKNKVEYLTKDNIKILNRNSELIKALEQKQEEINNLTRNLEVLQNTFMPDEEEKVAPKTRKSKKATSTKKELK